MAGTVSFMDSYVRRVVDDALDALFTQLPAILLDGPKATGKTATALQRAGTVRRLDNPAERAVMEANPCVIAGDKRPVEVDECQRAAGAWDAVRRLAGDDKTGGQYLYGPTGTPVAQVDGAGAGTHMHPNALGSVRFLTDDTGALDGS